MYLYFRNIKDTKVKKKLLLMPAMSSSNLSVPTTCEDSLTCMFSRHTLDKARKAKAHLENYYKY